MPPYTLPGTPAQPRALRTPFIDELRERPERIGARAAELRPKLIEAVLDGRAHEYLAFTGQAAGLVREILPAATIIERVVREAQAALRRARALVAVASWTREGRVSAPSR